MKDNLKSENGESYEIWRLSSVKSKIIIENFLPLKK